MEHAAHREARAGHDEGMDDAAIRDLVVRLSRPHPSGGNVIERAAIVAEGDVAAAVVEWILGHAGEGEASSPARTGGLHGGRLADSARHARAPLRYILPAGALDRPPASIAPDEPD
jgi:hypothetical protein